MNASFVLFTKRLTCHWSLFTAQTHDACHERATKRCEFNSRVRACRTSAVVVYRRHVILLSARTYSKLTYFVAYLLTDVLSQKFYTHMKLTDIAKMPHCGSKMCYSRTNFCFSTIIQSTRMPARPYVRFVRICQNLLAVSIRSITSRRCLPLFCIDGESATVVKWSVVNVSFVSPCSWQAT